MERLQQVLTLVRERLGQLTPAHKMIIGSAAIIAAMGLFLVFQYAGRADLVPLAVADDAVAQSARLLEAEGVQFRDASTGLLVPSSQKLRAVSIIAEHNLDLGENAHSNLRDILENQKWWQNRQQNQQAWNLGMSEFLSQLLSGWSYLRRADVVIDSPLQREGIGKPRGKPTASVAVMPRRNSLDREQVEAIANMVAGAVDGLPPSDVRIVDAVNGRVLRVEPDDGYQNSDYLELRASWEDDYTEKIYDTLRFIPNVIVAVNAQVVAGHERVQDLRYRGAGEGGASMLNQETLSSSEHSGRPSGGEPGVRTNTGTQIGTASGAAGETSETKDESASFDNYPGSTNIERFDPGGYARKINATINVPRSYFVSVWKALNPDSADPPDDESIAAVVEEGRKNIREMVTPLIDTTALNASHDGEGAIPTNGEVSVNMYYDVDMSFTSADATADRSDLGPFTIPNAFLGVTMRTVAVGGLALLSLFLMFRLVRGASRDREMPTANELLGIPNALPTDDEDLIGEADQAQPTMDAVEMDEDEIRARTLTEQVEDMVKSDPREAARLLDRWISTED